MSNDALQMAIDAFDDLINRADKAGLPAIEWRDAERALSALRQHQQDGGWRPIESAPKEGEILALIQGCDSKKFRRVVLSYDEFQEEWRFDGSAISNAWSIVGYQPLPPAPNKIVIDRGDVPEGLDRAILYLQSLVPDGYGTVPIVGEKDLKLVCKAAALIAVQGKGE